jgi:hypothetical protein
MWIQESKINADPDSGKLNQCGSGSWKAKSMRIRIPESQINADPGPGKLIMRIRIHNTACIPNLLYLYRRGLYDECGEVDDEQDPLQQDKDWEDYWRLLFPKVRLN